MTTHHDAIVIGTGQAGPSLAARLAGAGMNVAVIERKLYGGTCVNTGCVPTKALVASARAAWMAAHAGDWGVDVAGPVTVDMKRVKARKDEIAKKSRQGVEKWMKSLDGAAVYEGQARFLDAHTVEVGEDVLTADRIFINVGARAFVPPLEGIEDVPYLTNSDMMEIDHLPEHLVVVGGSYIGLEFAQMFARFGSRVSVVERGPRLIGRDDPDVSEAVREIVEADGVAVHLDTDCIAVKPSGAGVSVGLDCADEGRTVEGSHLLLAVGRVPNTGDLGLEAAGVEMDERGYIRVDDACATNVPGIWALGDCNGRGAFTHTSYNDHEIVAANLLDDDPRGISDRILCYGLYIDPPLGRVGMTETQARESGRNVLVGRRPMSRIGRAVEKGETKGFMKILVDADSEEILGAAILGVGGDEVVHSILGVMYAGAPYTVIRRAVHIHPTVSELIPTMLGELKPLE